MELVEIFENLQEFKVFSK